jgi:hypothetical protein
MANDALDPGPDGTYPYFPRQADGSPAWSDLAETDGIAVINPKGIPVAPMPRGTRVIRRGTWQGERILVDVTPTGPDGTPVDPPVLP